jgi:hypothetical protein
MSRILAAPLDPLWLGDLGRIGDLPFYYRSHYRSRSNELKQNSKVRLPACASNNRNPKLSCLRTTFGVFPLLLHFY